MGAGRGRGGQSRRGGGAGGARDGRLAARGTRSRDGRQPMGRAATPQGREVALQLLYQLDVHGRGRSGAACRRVLGAPSRRSRHAELRRGARPWNASSTRAEIDQLIAQLRGELGARAHGGGRPQHPPPGHLRAAVANRRAARRWRSTRPSRSRRSSAPHESSRFINGILDRIHKEQAPASLSRQTAHPIRRHLRRPRATSRRSPRCSPTPRARARTRCSAWATWSATAPTRWPAWSWWASGRARWWPATTSTPPLGLLDLEWFNPLGAGGGGVDRASSSTTAHRDYLTALPLVRTRRGRHAGAREPPPSRGVGLPASRPRTACRCSATSPRALLRRPLAPARTCGRSAAAGPDHAGRLDAPAAQVQLERRPALHRSTWAASASRAIAIPRACYAIWDREARDGDDPPGPYDHRGGGAEDPRRGTAAGPGRSARAVEPEPGACRRARAASLVVLALSGVLGALAFPKTDWSLLAWVVARARAGLGVDARPARRPRWTAGSPAPCSTSSSCAGSTTPSSTTARSPGR